MIGADAQGHAISSGYYEIADLRRILSDRPGLRLAADSEAKIRAGEQFVERKARESLHIYGVNTGLGALCETRISYAQLETVQRNLLLSHACGVGGLVSLETARTTLFLKLLTFRSGCTGISVATVARLLDYWNNDIIPAFPRKGTVGASGDLAPLAHMSLPLLGLGHAYVGGELVDGATLLRTMQWQPTRLKPKEGLALVNGVQYITALAVQALLAIEELLAAADLVAAISTQAFSCSRTFYAELYHETSHHLERQVVAANLRRLLESSNHFELATCNRSMQDPYSFRCIPQVHGAVRQTFGFAKDVVERELNGTSDNPLFFPDADTILYGGNLHGESIALVLDYLAIATSELGCISERRTYQLLSGQRSLPSFLVHEAGVNSGLMVAQYTAAALVNECKVCSTPASVDSIPTSQLQEDHVSMGGTSAYKLLQVIDNCEYILAIELIAAIQGSELNAELRLSPATQRIADEFRGTVPFLDRDRVLSDDIERSRALLREHRRAWTKELS